MGSDLKAHLFLDYDLWRFMNMLQSRIEIDIRWRKLDSYIDTRSYKDRQTPAGDELTIQLNTMMDK